MKGIGLRVALDTYIAPSNSVTNLLLATSSPQAVDVPAGAKFLTIAGATDFWIRFGSTAVAIPSSSTIGTTGAPASEYIPLYTTPRKWQLSTANTTGLSITSASSQWVCLQFHDL